MCRIITIFIGSALLLLAGCTPDGGRVRKEEQRSSQLEAELQRVRAQTEEAERRAAAYQEQAVTQARGLSIWQTVALILAIGACVALLAGIALGSVPRDPSPEEGVVQDADYEIVD